MRRRIAIGALAALALASMLGARPAAAGVDIHLNLITPPALVAVPGTPVAYAPAIPANYFFYNSQYYVFANGGWFVAAGYNGPWLALRPEYVPWPLLAVPIRYYRAAPWPWHNWYRSQPPRWTPVWGQRWRDYDHWPRRGDFHHDQRDRDDHRRDRPGNHGDHRDDHRRDRR